MKVAAILSPACAASSAVFPMRARRNWRIGAGGQPARLGGRAAFLLWAFPLGSKIIHVLPRLTDITPRYHQGISPGGITAGHTARVLRRQIMRVSDILKVKGNTLFTVTPDTTLHEAVDAMADHDIGSLVVMEYGDLVGMLTFREIILTLSKNGGSVGTSTIRKVMDDHPLTCTPETDVNEVRRMMLEHHVRYLPVLESRTLMGVISFYDVAKAVVEEQGFENRMLKAYIRDWPEEQQEQQPSR
jgi:CBS domain-containing protein